MNKTKEISDDVNDIFKVEIEEVIYKHLFKHKIYYL